MTTRQTGNEVFRIPTGNEHSARQSSDFLLVSAFLIVFSSWVLQGDGFISFLQIRCSIFSRPGITLLSYILATKMALIIDKTSHDKRDSNVVYQERLPCSEVTISTIFRSQRLFYSSS